MNNFYLNEFKLDIDHSYRTRAKHGGQYKEPEFQHKYGCRTMAMVIPKIFNGIPQEIRDLDKICKVKEQLKKCLISKESK